MKLSVSGGFGKRERDTNERAIGFDTRKNRKKVN